MVHDLTALRQHSAAEWKQRFDQRMGRSMWPGHSGVWGKKEWICPELDDQDIVSFGEGATPLQGLPKWAAALGVGELWLKQCGLSHTGSFKDLGMTVLVSVVQHARRAGRPIAAVACASTGDTSASLAAYAAQASLRCIVLLPRGKVSTAQLVQPLACGAHVLALETDFDGCMSVVQRLGEEAGVYLANSMNSLRLEGQKTVAIEIVQQLGWRVPDFVIIPGGNLGNVSALGAGFDMMEALGLTTKRPRIVVAQAEAANPLYLAYQNGWQFAPVAARSTMASAIQIGNPVSVHKAIRSLKKYDGVVEQASETELADSSARADREGQFTCPHTGVALAALEKLVKKKIITKHHSVAVISTANGLKFADFKVGYHQGTLHGVAGAQPNRPRELAADYDGVRRVVDEIVQRGAQ